MKNKPLPLVFSDARYVELEKGGDPLTLEILRLFRYGVLTVFNRVSEIEKILFVSPAPQPKKRGAKPLWDEGKFMYAWLAVEREHKLARKQNPSISVKAAIDAKFRKLRGKSWRILTDHSADARHLELAEAGTARRLHSQGRHWLSTRRADQMKWHALRDGHPMLRSSGR